MGPCKFICTRSKTSWLGPDPKKQTNPKNQAEGFLSSDRMVATWNDEL